MILCRASKQRAYESVLPSPLHAGLLLGKPENWPDYEIGMVDVMSMSRAISILGKDFLQKSGWRLSSNDVIWCRDKTVLHDIKLAREYRLLLGILREKNPQSL